MSLNKISVVHVRKSFVNKTTQSTILHDINATFLSNQSYAITGISGSGKSTLLNLIAGFDEPTEGSLFFNDRPLDIFSAAEKEYYAQQVIGFLFQKPYLIKELSVIENIMLPGTIAGKPYNDVYARACELLQVVGLAAYKDVKPGVLSGGQQQRACLARALCNKPFFLCADEPTAGLDAGHRTDIINLMRYGMQTWGMGVIVSTHDTIVAQSMQHVLALHEGVLKATTIV